MFPSMFESADKFIAFTAYYNVAFRIFLNCDDILPFGLQLLDQHGDPSFFAFFFQMIYPYRPFLKFL